MKQLEQIKEFKGEFAFLSNFHPAKILDLGFVFPTLEHAFVAHKTKNNNVQWRISKIVHPGQVKKFGRTISIRPDWDEIKLEVMGNLLVMKFQIPELRDLLVSTGERELIEGNWWNDKFWGMCLKTNTGENHLGKLLMEVRENLCR